MRPLEVWDSEATRQTFHNDKHHGLHMGRRIQKSEQDRIRYFLAAQGTKPDLIIETGTRWGGSARWFVDALNVDVISIDIDPLISKTARQADQGQVTYISGNSADPALALLIRDKIEDRRVMVSLDSDHHSQHVFEEIQLWGSFVTPGCHMVVEDGCFEFWTGDDARRGGSRIPEVGGPFAAIEKAGLEFDPRWTRDTEIEGVYPISHSPGGWWKRNV